MRYHYEKPLTYLVTYGVTYHCDHPVYSSCTLYILHDRGLAVIQQRYDKSTKHTWWSDIDPWLIDAIYIHSGFLTYFEKHAGKKIDDLYPTVTVRQIMWALRMPPIKREAWETVFDHTDI